MSSHRGHSKPVLEAGAMRHSVAEDREDTHDSSHIFSASSPLSARLVRSKFFFVFEPTTYELTKYKLYWTTMAMSGFATAALGVFRVTQYHGQLEQLKGMSRVRYDNVQPNSMRMNVQS